MPRQHTLVLDTCVWRHPPFESWFSLIRSAGHGLAIADQAARELLRQAVLAKHDAEFAKIQTACQRVVRYSTTTLQPIECHLSRYLGLGVGVVGHPDSSRMCRLVASAAGRSEFQSLASVEQDLGGGMGFVPADAPSALRREQLLWRRRWRRTMHPIAREAMRPRHKRGSTTLSAAEYTRNRKALLSDSRGLALDEVGEMARRFGPSPLVDWKAPELPYRLEPALTTYCAVLSEALLDRFDGPHNEGMPKIEFSCNDWYDVAQLRYVQADRVWVTNESVWHEMARRAGVHKQVLHPRDAASCR